MCQVSEDGTRSCFGGPFKQTPFPMALFNSVFPLTLFNMTSLSRLFGSASTSEDAQLRVRSPADDARNVGVVNVAQMRCPPRGTLNERHSTFRFRCGWAKVSAISPCNIAHGHFCFVTLNPSQSKICFNCSTAAQFERLCSDYS